MPIQLFLLFTLLHLERPKLHTILAFLSAVGFRVKNYNCIAVKSSSSEKDKSKVKLKVLMIQLHSLVCLILLKFYVVFCLCF